jgi:hypothetical protein
VNQVDNTDNKFWLFDKRWKMEVNKILFVVIQHYTWDRVNAIVGVIAIIIIN